MPASKEKMLQTIYDAIAEEYDGYYEDRIHQTEDQIVELLIKSAVTPDTRILDAGCGTGHAVTLGQLNADNYLGVDLSAKSIRVAESKHPEHEFMQGDITKLPEGIICDTALLLYGQVNYIGLDGFAKFIDKHLRWNGKFLAILYAREHPDFHYFDNHKDYYNVYTRGDILRELSGLDVRVHGLSYINYEDELVPQLAAMIKGGDTAHCCKYYVISNFIPQR